MGIVTVGEAILAGRRAFGNVTNISYVAQTALGRAVAAACPLIPFPESWSGSDAARICPSLDMVPVQALRVPETGVPIRNVGRLSVTEVLATRQGASLTAATRFSIDFNAALGCAK